MTIPALSAGVWVDGTPITPAQMNQLNALLPNLIDAVNGSSHTPSARININGTHGMSIQTLVSTAAEVGTLQADTSITSPAFVLSSTETPRFNVPLVTVGCDNVTSWEGPYYSPTYGPYLKQFGVGGEYYVHIPIPPLPVGCTITEIKARIKPDGTHAGGLPATMPRLLLSSFNPDDLTFANHGSQVDTSATYSDYDVFHTITLTGMSVSYDPSRAYILAVRGESGAGAVASSGRAVGIYSVTVQVSGSSIHL